MCAHLLGREQEHLERGGHQRALRQSRIRFSHCLCNWVKMLPHCVKIESCAIAEALNRGQIEGRS